jgi:hypothetical protein
MGFAAYSFAKYLSLQKTKNIRRDRLEKKETKNVPVEEYEELLGHIRDLVIIASRRGEPTIVFRDSKKLKNAPMRFAERLGKATRCPLGFKLTDDGNSNLST